eukprot:PhM_4_TR13288/c1_g1_i1/m.36251
MPSYVGASVLIKPATPGDGTAIRKGICRFQGETSFAPGMWIGVELPDASGKNNGTVNGVVYFHCAANAGTFVRPELIELDPDVYLPCSTKVTELSTQIEDLKMQLELANLEKEEAQLTLEDVQEQLKAAQAPPPAPSAEADTNLPMPQDVPSLQYQLSETRKALLTARVELQEVTPFVARSKELEQQLADALEQLESEQRSSETLEDMAMAKMVLTEQLELATSKVSELEAIRMTDAELNHTLEEALADRAKEVAQLEQAIHNLKVQSSSQDSDVSRTTEIIGQLRRRLEELEIENADLSTNVEATEHRYKTHVQSSSNALAVRRKNQSAIDAEITLQLEALRNELEMCQLLVPTSVAGASEAKAIKAVHATQKVIGMCGVVSKCAQEIVAKTESASAMLGGENIDEDDEATKTPLAKTNVDDGDGFVTVPGGIVKDVRWEAFEKEADAFSVMSTMALIARAAAYVENNIKISTTETFNQLLSSTLANKCVAGHDAVQLVFHEVVGNDSFMVRGTTTRAFQTATEAFSELVKSTETAQIGAFKSFHSLEVAHTLELISSLSLGITTHASGIVRYLDLHGLEASALSCAMRTACASAESIQQYCRGATRDHTPENSAYTFAEATTSQLCHTAKQLYFLCSRLQSIHERCWRACVDIKNKLTSEFIPTDVIVSLCHAESEAVNDGDVLDVLFFLAPQPGKVANSVAVDVLNADVALREAARVAQLVWMELHGITAEKIHDQLKAILDECDDDSGDAQQKALSRRMFADTLAYRLAIIQRDSAKIDGERKELVNLRKEFVETIDVLSTRTRLLSSLEKEVQEARAVMKGAEIDKAEVGRLRTKVLQLQSDFDRQRKEEEAVYEEAILDKDEEIRVLRAKLTDLEKKGGGAAGGGGGANVVGSSIELASLQAKNETMTNVARFYQKSRWSSCVSWWGEHYGGDDNVEETNEASTTTTTTTTMRQPQTHEPEVILRSVVQETAHKSLFRLPVLRADGSNRSEMRAALRDRLNNVNQLSAAYANFCTEDLKKT